MGILKVGDKVKVKEDLVSGEKYGEIVFTEGMEKYRGEIYQIRYIVRENLEFCEHPYFGYIIDEDNPFWFSEEMLALFPNKKEINIKVFEEPPQSNNVIDKYTVIINNDVFTMSENPNSPQGSNQYFGNINAFSLDYFDNKRELDSIPIEIVKAIINRLV